MSSATMAHETAPYAPTTASLGGRPNLKTDVPITSVFLFLFVLGAIANMYILQTNNRRGHKFLMSGMMFGFCMARITTMVMRIVWATRPHNVRIAIAANIFVAAGVVLLFVINLIFAQRMIRAAHPSVGWHRGVSLFFKILYILIVVFLIMLISSVVDSFYTLNHHTRIIDHRIQLSGQTYYALIAFLPIPLVFLILIVPRKVRLEKFGSGSWRLKVILLLTSSTLLSIGAIYRVTTNFLPFHPISQPPAYYSKAAFYLVNFTVEIIVIYMYIIVRVDRRFHVPNGSKGPGDYSQAGHAVTGEKGEHPPTTTNGTPMFRINTEEETFDDKDVEEDAVRRDVESGNRQMA